jgi:hypothetical protein
MDHVKRQVFQRVSGWQSHCSMRVSHVAHDMDQKDATRPAANRGTTADWQLDLSSISGAPEHLTPGSGI